MARQTKSITIDSAEFNKAAQRLIATSKKSTKTVLEEQGKLIIKEAALITPPNKNSKNNKSGGERTIRADLAKLFIPSRSKDAVSAGDLAQIHRKHRDRRGRVRYKGDKIKAQSLAAYRKTLLARVGKMAAGWKKAATKLGQSLPAWIERHSRAGSITYKTSGLFNSKGELAMTNSGVYAGQRSGLERRLNFAMKKQAGKINRRVDYFLKQNAKSAGFKVA
jgi:hypothetical protein